MIYSRRNRANVSVQTRSRTYGRSPIVGGGYNTHTSRTVIVNRSPRVRLIPAPILVPRYANVSTVNNNNNYRPEPTGANSNACANDGRNNAKGSNTTGSNSQSSRTAATQTSTQRNVRQPQTEYFYTKEISWDLYGNKSKVNIIVQNANGPSPLVALINSLVLTHLPTAKYTSDKTKISVNGILEYLGGLLVDTSGSEKYKSKNPNGLNDALKLLPKLNSGLDIDPCFDGSFNNDQVVSLFRSFNVELVHGWIVDPKSLFYKEIIETKSYKNAQRLLTEAESAKNQKNLLVNEKEALELKANLLNKSLPSPPYEAARSTSPNPISGVEQSVGKTSTSFGAELDNYNKRLYEVSTQLNTIDSTLSQSASAKLFLDQNPTQLTEYGLEYLGNSLAPDSVAVLFRNGQFSTIHRSKTPLKSQKGSERQYDSAKQVSSINEKNAGNFSNPTEFSDMNSQTQASTQYNKDQPALLALCTEVGYETRPEFVWQSLTPVSGEKGEFFDSHFLPSFLSPDRQRPVQKQGTAVQSGEAKNNYGDNGSSQGRSYDTGGGNGPRNNSRVPDGDYRQTGPRQNISPGYVESKKSQSKCCVIM